MSKLLHPYVSLYVGDLSQEISEAQLFEIFNAIGPVASIRVCRDSLTRRSLGYAYINYHSSTDAERALDTLNNTPIKGKPCRIMWSQRDPTVRRSGVGNIFIKNLPSNVGHKELFDTFSEFGNILSCKVAMENGDSKGFGFVHFESLEAADKAIASTNNTYFTADKANPHPDPKVKPVYVGKFVPKREWMRQKESSWTNVYVNDLDPEVTQADLQNHFATQGKIQSCVVMTEQSGVSKRFGFVNFEIHDDAVKAVTALSGSLLKNKKIWCTRAQKKSERVEELKRIFISRKVEMLNKYQGINLYVKNLEDSITEERLRQEFSVHGEIKSARLASENGVSKGFGFVCYTKPEEAQRAINEMHGRILSGCTKPLYVAFHETREIRKVKLSQRHAYRKTYPPSSNAGNPVYGYYNNPSQPGYNMPGTAPVVIRQQWPRYHNQHQAQVPSNYVQVPAHNSNRGRGAQSNKPRNNNNRRQGQQPGAQYEQHPAPAQPQPQLAQNNDLQHLHNIPADQQKLYLGERLYPLIAKINNEQAGKITGMLLDSQWTVEDLTRFLLNENLLQEKVQEALTVLQQAQQAQQTTSS